jgi:hypothetical protein
MPAQNRGGSFRSRSSPDLASAARCSGGSRRCCLTPGLRLDRQRSRPKVPDAPSMLRRVQDLAEQLNELMRELAHVAPPEQG